VRWCAILLEDESDGQQAIAAFENTLKERHFSDNLSTK